MFSQNPLLVSNILRAFISKYATNHQKNKWTVLIQSLSLTVVYGPLCDTQLSLPLRIWRP